MSEASVALPGAADVDVPTLDGKVVTQGFLAANHRTALEAIVGRSGIVLDCADMAAYVTPARYLAGRAACVLKPSGTQQVSEVVAYLVQSGLPFVPQSAHTGLVLGATPDASGATVVVSLERLCSPPIVNHLDRTVVVGAGTRLSKLNAALHPIGLELPIDLGADPMIGGMVATNAGGARFVRHGDMRRHVLEVEAVLPNRAGEIVRFGRGLRKDNSGLDLKHLMIGSCGSLGVITKVTLQVAPLPRQRACAIVIPKEPRDCLEILARLEQEAFEFVSAFEGMSGPAMSAALGGLPRIRNPFGGPPPAYAILIELTSSQRPGPGRFDLATLLNDIMFEVMEGQASPIENVIILPSHDAWALRHSLSEGLRRRGSVMGFDLSLRRSDVFAFREVMMQRLGVEFPDVDICDFGHVADGGLHFNLMTRAVDALDAARRRELDQCVLEIAVGQFGGSFSGEHGFGPANQQAYDKWTPEVAKSYAAKLRNVFAAEAAPLFQLGPRLTSLPGSFASE